MTVSDIGNQPFSMAEYFRQRSGFSGGWAVALEGAALVGDEICAPDWRFAAEYFTPLGGRRVGGVWVTPAAVVRSAVIRAAGREYLNQYRDYPDTWRNIRDARMVG